MNIAHFCSHCRHESSISELAGDSFSPVQTTVWVDSHTHTHGLRQTCKCTHMHTYAQMLMHINIAVHRVMHTHTDVLM